jgi:thiamine biosynthesis protein ThiI
MQIYIIRYGELALKGKNRTEFEKRLVRNIKDYLKKNKIEATVERIRGRIIVASESDASFKTIFGITSFSPAIEAALHIDDLKDKALCLLKNEKKSFKIDSKRLDKSFSRTSQELNKEIGSYVVDKLGLKVDLSNPHTAIGVEIVNKRSFIFSKIIEGFGGLPLGVEGKVVVLIENQNSLLAALLMMKRGCSVVPVAFSEKDISLLKKYAHGQEIKLFLINRIEDVLKIAKETRAQALVVGEILNEKKETNLNILILKPLAMFTDDEIKQKMRDFNDA